MTTRRLAAILAADVVGFSSMMERDEEGTLRRLKSAQRDLIEPRVREHHGRIVKTTGDGFLIEFGSPLDAVRCALEVQEALSANGGPEGSEALRFRMGINLGDIIMEHDGDIYGDGVNVATRLEQIAEPGSVCISGKVYDEIEGKLPTTFAFAGEQTVKNLARPVRVYSSKIMPGPNVGTKALPLPDKPSIAVLPFTNMSLDPEQDYFADGMVEDIITALSKKKWLMVIARNSTFTYKGRAVDAKRVGRELGVRYVLEGSVRKAARRLRISAARPELFRLLSDARPGDVLLVEQVDRLSRLTASDWEKLKAELATRRVRVVALDLPTSWVMATANGDDFTARMFDAINGMMLDVLAAVARKDYEDRRRRQAQGQTRAKAEGRYRGRKENVARNAGIASMLKGGVSWSQIQAATGCSRATIAKIAKRAGSDIGRAGFFESTGP